MTEERVEAESKVSGNQANIPARIRNKLGISDGDWLRWRLLEDGTIRIEPVYQRHGTFADFNGYDEISPTDVTTECGAADGDFD